MSWKEEYDRLFGSDPSISGDFHHDDVLRVIQMAIDDEREACRLIADSFTVIAYQHTSGCDVAADICDAIEERPELFMNPVGAVRRVNG